MCASRVWSAGCASAARGGLEGGSKVGLTVCVTVRLGVGLTQRDCLTFDYAGGLLENLSSWTANEDRPGVS